MTDSRPKADPQATVSDDALRRELPDPSESMVLLDQYQGGDEAALGELLERYQPRIRRIVRILLGRQLREKLQSMDVVQEVHLVALRKLKEFRPRSQGSLIHWLSQIALNKIRDENKYNRAGCRDVGREVLLDAPGPTSSSPGLEPAADSDMLPEERVWKKELREMLDDAVSQIPEHYQDVVVFRDYCGVSWKEVAERLGKSEGAVQMDHSRAWVKIRRIMAPRVRGLV